MLGVLRARMRFRIVVLNLWLVLFLNAETQRPIEQGRPSMANVRNVPQACKEGEITVQPYK